MRLSILELMPLSAAEGLPLAMKAKNRRTQLYLWGPLWLATMLSAQPSEPSHNVNWSDYGGGVDSMQYSPLQQINKSNVSQLTQAWFYAVPGTSARFNFSPLVIDGV